MISLELISEEQMLEIEKREDAARAADEFWVTPEEAIALIAEVRRLRAKQSSMPADHHPSCEHGACYAKCPVLAWSRAQRTHNAELEYRSGVCIGCGEQTRIYRCLPCSDREIREDLNRQVAQRPETPEVDRIAAWIDSLQHDDYSAHWLAEQIRSGAWEANGKSGDG